MFGGFIVAFCLFWVIYFFTKGLLPDWMGILAGSGQSVDQSLRQMILQFWAQTGGMFGQPIQVVAGNVLIFIVFGAVLMASGAGDLLMKIANRLTGGLVGGAAHAAVASSALFGTLSGAAISNVVSTGVMTIPVIRKAGFKPAFSGAVEAAASTGGQIMPPVMGVVAFFVAGQIGLEYRYIVVAAIVPAAFYYLGTFLAVYFEARKQGVGKLPDSERPRLTGTERFQCLVFLLPLGTLSYFLFAQPSVPKAGFYGFIVAVASAFVLFREFRSPRRIWKSFVDAGRMAATIVVIVTAIGLIVGLIQTSGFAGRLSLLLAQMASGPLPLVLLVVAFGAIVLGMGLPPGATYFIIVIALSSGIEAVGIAPLTLHLFVVIFAMMSTVTPPDAAEVSENLHLLMWFPYGEYHFAVRGDSDIELLDDIEGASVFLGPAGGGAFNTAKGWIAATTGLVAGEDYEAITANWATGFQSFLDGKIDMYVNGCMDPCQQFIQFTETETLRFIAP